MIKLAREQGIRVVDIMTKDLFVIRSDTPLAAARRRRVHPSASRRARTERPSSERKGWSWVCCSSFTICTIYHIDER